MTIDARSTIPTHDRVLQAGVDLWVSSSPAELFAGLNVSRLAKAAGITRATFYTYWSTIQDYLDELVEYVVNREPTGFPPEVAAAMNRLTLDEGHVLDDFLTVCSAQIRHLAEDPTLRLRLGLLAKLDDPVVAEKLIDQYADLEGRMTERYTEMLDRWGRRARPPLRQSDLSVMYTVLMDGFAARYRLAPDLVSPETYGWAAVAFLYVLTARRDDDRDLSDMGAFMNHLNADGDRVREAERRTRPRIGTTASTDGVVPEPQTVVERTRRLLVDRPWPELSIEEVATATGTTADEVLRLFGSKHGLGVAVIQLIGDEAFGALPVDPDPITHLRNLLVAGAAVLRRSPALTQSATLVFAGMTEGAALGVVRWNPDRYLIAAVAACQRAGQLSDAMEPAEFAAAIMRTQLTQQTPMYASPFGSTIDTVELLLLGAGAPPALPH